MWPLKFPMLLHTVGKKKKKKKNLFLLIHLSEFFFKNFPIENSATKKLIAINLLL